MVCRENSHLPGIILLDRWFETCWWEMRVLQGKWKFSLKVMGFSLWGCVPGPGITQGQTWLNQWLLEVEVNGQGVHWDEYYKKHWSKWTFNLMVSPQPRRRPYNNNTIMWPLWSSYQNPKVSTIFISDKGVVANASIDRAATVTWTDLVWAVILIRQFVYNKYSFQLTCIVF